MNKPIVVTAVVAVMFAAPAAASATRFVTPAGTPAGDCQSVATACDLKTAIEGNGSNVPSNGEEVIIQPGTYSLASDINEPIPNLNIHGVFGQPRPVINQTTPSAAFKIQSGTFSYLDLESGAGEVLNLSGGIAERLFMRGAANGGFVCQCGIGGVLRDSVVVSTGPSGALGIVSNGGTANGAYRNVTAIATDVQAPAIALVHSGMPSSLHVDAYNVIARNLAGGTDVRAVGDTSSITFHRSNYATIDASPPAMIEDAPGDPHQTAFPLFTNPAAADFSEAVGSPTINAGLTDALNGPLDFVGDARSLDGATDIGAYEYLPPTATAPPGPTGKRAAALKKCKKKHPRKKRKRCKKRARRLPV